MPGAVSWPGSRRNPGPDAVPGLPGRRRGIIPRYFARGTPDDFVQSARPPDLPRLRPGRASAPGRRPELPDHADRADRGDVLPDDPPADEARQGTPRSEEHTSELQSLMRISYAVFCLKTKKTNITTSTSTTPS